MMATKTRANKEQAEKRVNDILRIMLDGAQRWDLVDFVREREKEPDNAWTLAEGDEPLCYSQIRRYVARAKRIIADTGTGEREELLRKAIAQRENLYAKAVSQGDMRAALAILDSRDRLLRLFPSDERKPGAIGHGDLPPLSVIVQMLIQAEGAKPSIIQTAGQPVEVPLLEGETDEGRDSARNAAALVGSEKVSG
jgi:hypothetical protein